MLIEGKNPTIEKVGWTDAYKQIKRYEDQAPELFKYVQFSIVTDGIKTYYFPNAFRSEEEERSFLAVWKDPYPFKKEEFKDDILKITIYGLLSKQNLLDIIENFTFIRKERDKSTKIMARYMQFRASNKIFQRVRETLRKKGNEKFGLIWHWQGSGKTYTMAFSAWKLLHCPEAETPSVFVIVDRRELEEQIEKDFSFIEVPIEKVSSIKQLVEILRWGKGGKRGIFLVTIEKFRPKEFAELEKEAGKIEIERENVIILADEAHRTQYGKFATLMRSVFKKSFIFGFTGTPLSKNERNTFQRFCPPGELYLDRYSMLDAMLDGFTIPLSYQANLPEYHLNKKQLEEFVKFEEEEIKTLSKEEQRELRKKVSAIKAFVKKKDRIEAIAADIASHFKEVVEPTGLNALIVTIDREACVLYKDAINKFLAPSYSEIVMTFNPNETGIIKDYLEQIQRKYGNRNVKEIHQKVIDNFKAGKEPRILIVTDMLITGFDAPNLWVMYLDKPLKEHRLLQAIARTDRPFLNKKFGLIVDYIGILPELEKAFEKFEASDAKGLKVVIRDLSKEKESFEELITEALKIFEGGGGKANVDELKIDEISKKTISLIQKTIDVKEIESAYPTISIDERYIELLKKSPPKTVGAAIDVVTNLQHEIRRHPTSPFFLNLSKEVERLYEDLRTRKIMTEETMQRILKISEQIKRWKKEEEEIGKNKYPIYEALKSVLPEIEKEKALSFIDKLLTHLEKGKLLFKGWQLQREVRRKVIVEIRFLLLSEFRNHRDKVDKLTDEIFRALEGMEWPG